MVRPGTGREADVEQADLLEFFVYGTLRRGEANRHLFGRAELAREPAWLHGRLYLLPEGYPALVLPPGAALADGGRGAAEQARLQRAVAAEGLPQALPVPAGRWMRVEGERVVTRADDRLLRRLDALEAYDPARPAAGEYRRALVPVVTAGGVRPLWLWWMPDAPRRGRLLPAGRWPPGRRRPGPRRRPSGPAA